MASTCPKGKIMSKTLSLVDVLQRSLAQNKEDITPLLGYLSTTKEELNLQMERSSTRSDAENCPLPA
jgi:hypothetical protein